MIALYVFDWALVVVGGIGALMAIVAMAKNQHR
jgi:hypothetical protein